MCKSQQGIWPRAAEEQVCENQRCRVGLTFPWGDVPEKSWRRAHAAWERTPLSSVWMSGVACGSGRSPCRLEVLLPCGDHQHCCREALMPRNGAWFFWDLVQTTLGDGNFDSSCFPWCPRLWPMRRSSDPERKGPEDSALWALFLPSGSVTKLYVTLSSFSPVFCPLFPFPFVPSVAIY